MDRCIAENKESGDTLTPQQIMQRNAHVLREALTAAEKRLVEEEKRWEQPVASRERRILSPSRKSVAKETTKTKKTRELGELLKRRSLKVAESFLLYKYQVEPSTKTFIECHNGLDQTLIDRAQNFLMRWRMSLKQGDRIASPHPDHLDEYEFDDKDSGFIKSYEALVKETASEGALVPEGSVPEKMETKATRLILPEEKAIYVHYVGFGSKGKRWIVLSREDQITEQIFPKKAHLKITEALANHHHELTDIEGITSQRIISDESNKAIDENGPLKAVPRTSNKPSVNPVLDVEMTAPAKKRQRRNEVSPSPTSIFQNEVNEPACDQQQLRIESSNKTDETEKDGAEDVKISKNRDTNVNMGHDAAQETRSNIIFVPTEQVTTDFSVGSAKAVHLEEEEHALTTCQVSEEQNNKDGANKGASVSQKECAAREGEKAKEMKKRQKPEEKEPDDFTWICTECKEADCIDAPESPLMICQGRCHRPFHYPCVGLDALPSADETWICQDCKTDRHQCVVCGLYGEDDYDVFCCKEPKCGRFFHESCLSMYNVDVELIEEEGQNTGLDLEQDYANVATKPRFKCPAHACWTCNEEIMPQSEENDCAKKSRGKRRKKRHIDASFSAKKGRLYHCLVCPIAYHSSCIPPSARFHELALLCHEHASTSKLPDLDFASSFQGEVEARADAKIEKIRKDNRSRATNRRRGAKGGFNPFFPGVRGDLELPQESKLRLALPEADSSFVPQNLPFCLPCDFKSEVHSRPPTYRQVHSLRYNNTNRPKRRPPQGESCRCKSTCDEQCLNRVLMIECCGDRSKSNGVKNPYWNCELGPGCGNRNLALRKFAKCRPKRERGRGWGLISVNGCKKGDLVQEYTGEVVDERTKEERLKNWERDHPNDPNFYLMYLDTGWYIDARLEGSVSRFINHSCEPNCRLVRVNVGGYMRVAIYCCRDVEPGQFLSYDYQFDTKHGDKFVCRCGAKNCRGTMKGGRDLTLEDEEDTKTKKEAISEARARYDRDKKFLEDLEKEQSKRLWQIDTFVPGSTSKDALEAVASGPQERYRETAQTNRIFLWRNAVQGSKLHSRFTTMQECSPQKMGSNLHDTEHAPYDVISLLNQKEY